MCPGWVYRQPACVKAWWPTRRAGDEGRVKCQRLYTCRLLSGLASAEEADAVNARRCPVQKHTTFIRTAQNPNVKRTCGGDEKKDAHSTHIKFQNGPVP